MLGPLRGQADDDGFAEMFESDADAEEADLESAAALRQSGLRSEVGKWYAASEFADRVPIVTAICRQLDEHSQTFLRERSHQ